MARRASKIGTVLWNQADECLLLAALEEADRRRPGDLHLVRLVRVRAELPKARFDDAALRLSERREIVLHHHDYPGSLSPDKLAELIHDRRAGVYYVGIALTHR